MSFRHVHARALTAGIALWCAASGAHAYNFDLVVLESDRAAIYFAQDGTPADHGSLLYAARFLRAAAAVVPAGSRLYVHCVERDVAILSATPDGELDARGRALSERLERHREDFERGIRRRRWHRLRTCLARIARHLDVVTGGRFAAAERSARLFTLAIEADDAFWLDHMGLPPSSGSVLDWHDGFSYPASHIGLFLDRADAEATARALADRVTSVSVIDLTRTRASEGMPEP